ncbi:MAG TPA: serine/threonine protein kinase, partial [Vicinamibacteria bacterium]
MEPDSDAAATSALDPAEGDEPALAGSSIGPYRVIRLLGRGGMGAVYLAEQEEPIRRQVALKVVRFGLETKQVLARFEAERQSLARMSHPGIAQVYDA